MEEWKNNSITYYRWWLTEVGFHYLTYDQQTRALVNSIRNFRHPLWNVSAAKKALSFRTEDAKQDTNYLARQLGREGEKVVVSYLESKDWKIMNQPSTELHPEFGTSTSGYDIIARHGTNEISVEVKSVQGSCPLWTLSIKSYKAIITANTDYLAIVHDDDVHFCAVKDLAFDEPVYSHDGLDYPRHMASRHLLVINPACLKKISRKEMNS